MKYNRHNKAFTLAEVILAIGIMGIGMVFAACLFPAAIKESELSSAAMEGTIIAQNGLTIAQEILTQTDVTGPSASSEKPGGSSNFVWVDSRFITNTSSYSVSNTVFGYSSFYPTPISNFSPTSTNPIPSAGFIILARKKTSDPADNDYIIISVAYRKRQNGTMRVDSVSSCNLPQMSKELTVPSGNANLFLPNGIIIVDSDTDDSGKMVRIVSKNGTTVTLEHPLSTSTTPITKVLVINEQKPDNSGPVGETPILSAQASRTSLN